MAPRTMYDSVRFARLARSGRGLTINMPRQVVDALEWTYGDVLELWIEGRELRVHKAHTTRDLERAGVLEALEPARDAGRKGLK